MHLRAGIVLSTQWPAHSQYNTHLLNERLNEWVKWKRRGSRKLKRHVHWGGKLEWKKKESLVGAEIKASLVYIRRLVSNTKRREQKSRCMGWRGRDRGRACSRADHTDTDTDVPSALPNTGNPHSLVVPCPPGLRTLESVSSP